MRHVVVHLTPETAHPEPYRDGKFLPAVGQMLRLACALAAAQVGVTVRIAPDFLASPQAAAALQEPGAEELDIEQAPDSAGLYPRLHALRPHACLIWNGGWEPDLAPTCHLARIRPVFAETGWFDRENSLILDTVSVLHTSDLGGAAPEDPVPLHTRRTRLAITRRDSGGGAAERPHAGDYLLVLVESGDGSYHHPAYADINVLIADLRRRFPARTVALRAHPSEPWRLPLVLPPGMLRADSGSVMGWAAHCTAAIGASSKATFAAALFARPVVLIGHSMADGTIPTAIFPHRQRITDITDADLAGEGQAGPASAFLYEALFRRHVFLDDCAPWALRRNRVLEPLLPPPLARRGY